MSAAKCTPGPWAPASTAPTEGSFLVRNAGVRWSWCGAAFISDPIRVTRSGRYFYIDTGETPNGFEIDGHVVWPEEWAPIVEDSAAASTRADG